MVAVPLACMRFDIGTSTSRCVPNTDTAGKARLLYGAGNQAGGRVCEPGSERLIALHLTHWIETMPATQQPVVLINPDN